MASLFNGGASYSPPPPPPPMPILAPATPMPIPDKDEERRAALKEEAMRDAGKTTRASTIIGGGLNDDARLGNA